MLLEKLIVSIEADINKLKSGLDAAAGDIGAFGKKLTIAGAGLTAGVTLPLAMIGKSALDMAMNAVESENLFEVSMGGMAESARAWSEELSASLGLNAYELRKTAGTFDVMLKSMGLGEQSAYDMSTGLSELSYDMASFYNLKPEEAFQKLQAGISGEIEPLKRLGILVNENTIKAYALKTGMIAEGEEMTEQQKIQARYGAIMEQTSLAQGDLARTMDSPTNKLRLMGEQINKLKIAFGNLLIPVLQAAMKAVQPLVEWLTNLDDKGKIIVLSVLGVVAAIGPLLTMLGTFMMLLPGIVTAFSAVSGFMLGPWGIAIAAVIAGVLLLVDSFGGWGATMEKLQGWLATAKEAWSQFMSGFTGDPITGVITPFQQFGFQLRDIFDGIKDFASRLMENLQPLWDRMKESLVKLEPTLGRFKQIWADLQPVLMVIGSILAAVAAVIVGVVMGAINGLFNAIDGIVQAFQGVIAVISGVVESIIAIFSGDWTGLEAANEKIKQGILDIWGGLWSAVSGFVSGFVTGVIDFFTGLYDTLIGHSIIPDMINGIIEWFVGLPAQVLGVISTFVTNLIGSFTMMSIRIIGAIDTMVLTIIARLKASPIFGPIIDGITEAYNTVSGMVSKFISIGASIANGIKDGISNAWSGLVSKLKGLVDLLPKAVKDILGIKSPSKVFAGLGKELPAGLAVGIQDLTSQAVQAAKTMAQSVISAGALAVESLPSLPSGPLQMAMGTADLAMAGGAIGSGPSIVEEHYHFGDITVPVKDLEDIKTVSEFVGMLRRKKRQAGGE